MKENVDINGQYCVSIADINNGNGNNIIIIHVIMSNVYIFNNYNIIMCQNVIINCFNVTYNEANTMA